MDYNIIEVHTKHLNGILAEIAVLWVSNEEEGWVRASYATTKPIWGYKYLMPEEMISDRLIQEVAGLGMNLPDDKKKKFFPGKRKWEQ
ncbi:MAG TPA: hypothetical protein DEO70_12065 [Bacteroidales bacterium]|nr:MAG: hypothetical protein A2X11_10055 [Bacteroidetes bacterium GWE2_42_24]OFY25855.1 MAG: hypothetical protein A2X09_09430 [Bacteroidetes bacterium GWF2_43_11]HBZ67563.1 hypothetical protein [Bacteroidales bacterium]